MYNVKDDLKNIKAEAVEICDLLEIATLPLAVKSESEVEIFKASPTCKACVEVEVDNTGNEKIKGVYIRNNQADRVNCLFNLVHELRHVWQHKNGLLNSTNYTERNETDSVGKYNEQFAEIDAHAFAVAYMLAEFGVRMKLEASKMTQDTMQRIEQRVQEILHEYWEMV